MIYVPTDLLNKNCYVVNEGYIRVYTDSELRNFTDVLIHQDYMLRNGVSVYPYTGSCDSINTFTDDYHYRIDFPDIVQTAFIQFIIIFILAYSFYRTIIK